MTYTLPRPEGYRGPWNPCPGPRALASASRRGYYGPLGGLVRAYIDRRSASRVRADAAEAWDRWFATVADLPEDEFLRRRSLDEAAWAISEGHACRVASEASGQAEEEVAALVARTSVSNARGRLRAWLAGPVDGDGERRL